MATIHLYANVPLTNKYSNPILFKYKDKSDFLTSLGTTIGSFQNVNIPKGSILETRLTIDADRQYSPSITNCNYAMVVYDSMEAQPHSGSTTYFYFVKNIHFESSHKIRFDMELDVFTTYGTEIEFSTLLLTKRKHSDRWISQGSSYICKTNDAMLYDEMDGSFKANLVRKTPTTIHKNNDLFGTELSRKLSEIKWTYVFYSETNIAGSECDAPVKNDLNYINGSTFASTGESPTRMKHPLKCVVFPSKAIWIYAYGRVDDSTPSTRGVKVRWSIDSYDAFLKSFGSNIVSVVVSDYAPFTQKSNDCPIKVESGAIVIGSDTQRIMFDTENSFNGKTLANEDYGSAIGSYTFPYSRDDMQGVYFSASLTSVPSGANVHWFKKLSGQSEIDVFANLTEFNPKFQYSCDGHFVGKHWKLSVSSLLPTITTLTSGELKDITLEPKLYTQPYSKYELRSYGVNSIEIEPIIDSTSIGLIEVGLACTITPEGVILSLCKETGYEGKSSYFGGKMFPKNIYLPVSKDQYQSYMAYNGNQFQSEFVMSNIQHAIQSFSTTPAKHFSNMGSGTMGGGSISIAQTAVALGANQLQDQFDWANTIVSYNSKIKDLKDAPDNYTGVSQSPFLTELQGTPYDWLLIEYSLIDEEKEIVFDYFYNNGYEVNRMCFWGLDDVSKIGNKDNILGRKLFNYVQLADDGIIEKMRCNIPHIAKLKIASVLSRGCKLWLLQDTTDYSLYLTETRENPERYF